MDSARVQYVGMSTAAGTISTERKLIEDQRRAAVAYESAVKARYAYPDCEVSEKLYHLARRAYDRTSQALIEYRRNGKLP